MGSLRRRALINAVAAAALSVAVVSIALFAYIDAATLKRFDREVEDRHTQLVVALSDNAQDRATLERVLIDPAYQRPYSGRYWQAQAPDGTVYTSPSLFGAIILAAPTAPTDRLARWTGPAPDGGQLRGMQQRITLEDGSVWTVTVAETLNALLAERYETRKSLLIAFGIVVAFGLLSAWLQVAVVLRPLGRLRQEVATRWERDARLDPNDYPSEVAPLVADIDLLLARNKETVARARRQASDLAHALKTPSAILRNELVTLQQQGQEVGPALDALGRLDAQLRRSLARMRAIHSSKGAGGPINPAQTVDRLSRLFGTMCARQCKQLEIASTPDLQVWIDRQDLEEVLGNLLDNALKWGRTTIRLGLAPEPGGVALCVEDDGPGIPEAERVRVLESGARLDLSVPGTGLGLAIASDLVSAYGGRLELSESARLGGLIAAIHLPHRAGLLRG